MTMNARFLRLVVTTLFILLIIGSGAAFADGSARHYQPGHGGYYNQNGANYHRGGGHYYYGPSYYPHANYYHYNGGGPPVRSYSIYKYYGPAYGNCSPGYGGSRAYFSGSYYVPGFGFSFGAIGR
jgi:hypothetical protein